LILGFYRDIYHFDALYLSSAFVAFFETHMSKFACDHRSAVDDVSSHLVDGHWNR